MNGNLPELALLILITAVFSVVTSTTSTILASTNEENDPEEEAENAAEEGETTVYDDNPDLDKDGTVTEEENQKFTDAAVALGDKLNNPDQEEDNNNKEDYTVTCWNGEEVAELSDCPEDDGSIICDDGSEAIRISDCPETAAPAPLQLPPCDGSYQDCVTPQDNVCEAGSTEHECESSVTCSDGTVVDELSDCSTSKPNPYCDLLPDGFRSVTCHDRKDASDKTGLYTCNDGTHKVDWKDCKDATKDDKVKEKKWWEWKTNILEVAIMKIGHYPNYPGINFQK